MGKQSVGGMDIYHQVCPQILQFCCLEQQFSMFSVFERVKLFAGAAHSVKIHLSLISELNFSQLPFPPLDNLVNVTAGERL